MNEKKMLNENEVIEKITNFLSYTIEQISEKKPEIAVAKGAKTLVFDCKVDKSIVGRVIGKQGKTIRALKVIAIAIGAIYDYKVIVNLVEP